MAETQTSGIVRWVGRLFESGLAAAQTRVELFAIEMREEQCRVLAAMFLGGVVLALGVLSLTLLTLAIVLLVPEASRLAALITLAVVYAVTAVTGGRLLWRRLRIWTPFASTIDEFKKDRACLLNWQNSDNSSKNS